MDFFCFWSLVLFIEGWDYGIERQISVILWRSVLLVGDTGVPWENHRATQVTDKLFRIMFFYPVHLAWVWFEPTTLVMIGTHCIGSYKTNHHTTTTRTVPMFIDLDKVIRQLILVGKKKIIARLPYCSLYWSLRKCIYFCH